MADEKALKAAKAVYADICNLLDERKWTYDRHDSDLKITTGACGNDNRYMEIQMHVDANRQLVLLYSPLPINVPYALRREISVAVACANHGMVNGNFDYDSQRDKIIFRVTTSFRESKIDAQAYAYMIGLLCYIVNKYFDKFLAVVRQNMSVDEILNFIE